MSVFSQNELNFLFQVNSWTCSHVHEKVWAFGAQESLLHRWLTVLYSFVCLCYCLVNDCWCFHFISLEIRLNAVTIAIAITITISNAINIYTTDYMHGTAPCVCRFPIDLRFYGFNFNVVSIVFWVHHTLCRWSSGVLARCLSLSVCLSVSVYVSLDFTETVGSVYIDLWLGIFINFRPFVAHNTLIIQT